MPAYEYRCRDCGEQFEVRRSMSAPAERPACPGGHLDTTRVFSAVAVGSGVDAGPAAAAAGAMPASGGCCGGGCCG